MIEEEGYEASVFSHEGTVYVNELFLYQGEAARVGPDGLPVVHPRALYLTHTEGVSVIRTMTHELLRDFEWDETPSDVLASKDGKTVYALLSESQRLGVLGTLALDKRGYQYGLEKGAGDIVLGPDGNKAFIANALADSIQVIDLKTREIIKTFPTGSMPSQILLTADGRTLFVSNRLDKTISKLNAQTGEEEKVIPVGGSPFGLVLSKNEEKLFVADTANDKVLVYDAQNFNRLGEIEVGRAPHVLLISPEGKLFVSNRGSATVSIIDVERHAEIVQIPVGERPHGMAMTPEGNKLYVANQASSSVSLISKFVKPLEIRALAAVAEEKVKEAEEVSPLEARKLEEELEKLAAKPPLPAITAAAPPKPPLFAVPAMVRPPAVAEEEEAEKVRKAVEEAEKRQKIQWEWTVDIPTRTGPKAITLSTPQKPKMNTR